MRILIVSINEHRHVAGHTFWSRVWDQINTFNFTNRKSDVITINKKKHKTFIIWINFNHWRYQMPRYKIFKKKKHQLCENMCEYVLEYENKILFNFI